MSFKIYEQLNLMLVCEAADCSVLMLQNPSAQVVGNTRV